MHCIYFVSVANYDSLEYNISFWFFAICLKREMAYVIDTPSVTSTFPLFAISSLRKPFRFNSHDLLQTQVLSNLKLFFIHYPKLANLLFPPSIYIKIRKSAWFSIVLLLNYSVTIFWNAVFKLLLCHHTIYTINKF